MRVPLVENAGQSRSADRRNRSNSSASSRPASAPPSARIRIDSRPRRCSQTSDDRPLLTFDVERWMLDVERSTAFSNHPRKALRDDLPQRRSPRRRRRPGDPDHHPPLPQEPLQGGAVGRDAPARSGHPHQPAPHPHRADGSCSRSAAPSRRSSRSAWRGRSGKARRSSARATRRKTSTVVLLDNSYSMEAGRAGTSNFVARPRRSRAHAQRTAPRLRSAGRAHGRRRRAAARRADLRSRARSPRRSSKLDAGYGAATVPAALDFAAGVFGKMHEPSRAAHRA